MQVYQNELKWCNCTEVNTNGPNGAKWTEWTKKDRMGTRRTELDQRNRTEWTNVDRVGTNRSIVDRIGPILTK